LPVTVESPVEPQSVYARTKLEAEKKLAEEAKKLATPKLTIARVFSVLSEAMKPGYLLTNLHRRAQEKDFSPIPGLSYIRDFLTAPQICEKLITLSRNIKAPGLVLICSGQGWTIRQIAEQVFEQYGLDSTKLKEAPARSSDITYLVGTPSLF